MIAEDEDALICDFAETYHIYDYRQLPARLAAVYACGLRHDSRIMMKMSGMKVSLDTLMLAMIADAGKLSVWQATRDGMNGKNVPDSILQILLGTEEKETAAFSSPEEFMAWRKTMIEG